MSTENPYPEAIREPMARAAREMLRDVAKPWFVDLMVTMQMEAIAKVRDEIVNELVEACEGVIADRIACHETEAAYIPPYIRSVYKAIAKARGE